MPVWGTITLGLNSLGFLQGFLQPPQDLTLLWELPKIKGALCWGPYNKDPTL